MGKRNGAVIHRFQRWHRSFGKFGSERIESYLEPLPKSPGTRSLWYVTFWWIAGTTVAMQGQITVKERTMWRERPLGYACVLACQAPYAQSKPITIEPRIRYRMVRKATHGLGE
jgi:hypothetical protein